jgi:hypothetical protein
MMGCTPEIGNRHSVCALWIKLHAVPVFEEIPDKVWKVKKTSAKKYETLPYDFRFSI